MPELRGFKNVGVVNQSIREIFLRLSPRRVAQFGNTFDLMSCDYGNTTDPVVRVQKLAMSLACHYRLYISAVVVAFRANLSVPGHVQLTSNWEFFIELHSKYTNDVRSTVAILAHEIAHIFLYQRGIRFSDTFENEVLTDTAAILLGCGPAILNGANTTTTRSFSYPTITTTTSSSHFGYISIDEMGYVQAKRDFLLGSKPSRFVRRGFPRSGYRRGRWAFRTQRRRPPYARFKSAAGLWGELRKVFGRNSAHPMTFACFICSQRIRVPILGKKLAVRCPTCGQRLICYT